MSQNLRFRSSYQGEAEYDLSDGRRISVRTFADPAAAYNTGVYLSEIEPLVGCVRFVHAPDMFTFPDASIMAEFPGFVAARFTRDYKVEYDGVRPELARDPILDYVWSCPVLKSRPYEQPILDRAVPYTPETLAHCRVSIARNGTVDHRADFFGRHAVDSARRYLDGSYVTRKRSEGYEATFVQPE
jgi:hypothetical protein